MRRPEPRNYVIGYMSGPADGAEIVRRWKQRGHTDYFGTVYMTQFCDVVREAGARGLILTYRSDAETADRIDEFTIYNLEHKPRSGLGYHLELTMRMLRSFVLLWRHGARIVVLTEGANYWFLTVLLRITGIKIIPSLHCVIWTPFNSPNLVHRVLNWLNRNLFFRLQRTPFMGVSNMIGRQVQHWAGAHARFFRFLPTYSPETFSGIGKPHADAPFTVLFAGRVERNKGVFDLMEAAEIVRSRGTDIRLHICGEGTALDEARQTASESTFVHGACNRETLQQLFGESHAVAVPTRTDFEEGFAKICAEAVLAGRPVITSAVCPALEDIREAAVEVTPNDVRGYADAIERLATDRNFYAEKAGATAALQAQFYDPGNSYGSVLRKVIHIVDREGELRTSDGPHELSSAAEPRRSSKEPATPASLQR